MFKGCQISKVTNSRKSKFLHTLLYSNVSWFKARALPEHPSANLTILLAGTRPSNELC